MDFSNRVSSLAILNSPHNRGEEEQAIVERAASVQYEGPMATMEARLNVGSMKNLNCQSRIFGIGSSMETARM